MKHEFKLFEDAVPLWSLERGHAFRIIAGLAVFLKVDGPSGALPEEDVAAMCVNRCDILYFDADQLVFDLGPAKLVPASPPADASQSPRASGRDGHELG